MARRRVMEYGPSVRTPRNSMRTVSVIGLTNRRGVFFRQSPGLAQTTTKKSDLTPRVRRGIEPPGFQPRNYPTPNQ